MSLKQYLANCPEEHGLDTSKIRAMRQNLRRRLFDEATQGERYRHMLFAPGVDTLHPKPSEWLGEPRRSHAGRPCVRRLRQGEPAYRCSTCGLDDTCVLCQYCYRPEDHVGHDVFMRITHRDDGGICDCGDAEAWKIPLTCAAQNLESESGHVPEDLEQSIGSAVSQALDFCIDVMAGAHCGLQFMDKASDVLKNVHESRLDPAVYGPQQEPVDKYILVLWNDERRSLLDANIAIQLVTQKSAEFGIMVARRVDAYGRGKIKVSTDLSHLMELKLGIQLFTSTLRSVRDYMREEMVDEIIHWLLDLTWARLAEGPASTLRNIVGQAMCDPWQCGLEHLNLGGSMSMGAGMASHSLWHNSSLDGKRIPTLNDRTRDNLFHDVQPPSQDSDLFDFETEGMTFNALSSEPIWVDDSPPPQRPDISARFKYLIFFDLRFWKSLRQTLQDLYVSALISNQSLKMYFGREYADFYPQIAELYVLLDREPEVSCIQSLSTQLFTTPSVATELLNGPHFSQYIASLFTLLTLQKIGPLSCINQDMKLDADSPILKNRRFGQLFQEISFLLSRNSVKQNVAGNARTLLQIADFLSLCQGLSPVRRQQDKHIEFESEGWVYVFTTIPFVLQLGQGVATGAFECTFDAVREPIAKVARLLHRWSFQYMSRAQKGTAAGAALGTAAFGTAECVATFGERSVRCLVSDYDPSEGIVSFHHPVHAFLSFLLQNCHIPNVQALRSLLFDEEDLVPAPESALDMAPGLRHAHSQFVRSMLFEHPLQCIAVLSQVRVGLWVRNGYTMRSQLHHYRESTLRELAYAQDLFMAQMALVVLDTNVAMCQLLKRFGLDGWRHSTLFDDSQRFYMLEEFLHTLHTLLVDRIYLQDHKQEKINQQYYRREIVQALTFMDLSYSDICRIVPESMTADDEFELVLKACATFSPPKGVSDVGTYSLREELLHEFNPRYTHFSSARIEEAERAISRRLAPSGTLPEEFVYVAPLQQLYGAWSDLGAFTRSVAFAAFMHDLFCSLVAMYNADNKADIETVLSSAIYLLIMAAKDDAQRDHAASTTADGVYASLREWVTTEHNGASFASVLAQMLQAPQLSALHPRVRKLCDVLGLDLGLNAGPNAPSAQAPEQPDERKTKAQAAKKRIMEEMRQQRRDFEQQQDADDVEMATDEPQDEEGGWSFARTNCVLCHMPETPDSIFGQMTFTCHVSVLREHDHGWSREAFGHASSLDAEEPRKLHDVPGNEWWKRYWTEDEDTSFGPSYPQQKIRKQTEVVGGCGHGVHFSCYKDYLELQSQRVSQQMRLTAEDTKNSEYLCPLCRAINNGFAPVVWRTNAVAASDLLSGEHPYVLPELEARPPALLTANILMPGAQDALNDPNSALVAAFHEQALRVGRGEQGPPSGAPSGSPVLSAFSVFSDTVKTMEIALRGRPNQSPFGGLLVDQLAGKQVKNLRVMAHYLDVVQYLVAHDTPPAAALTGDPLLNLIYLIYSHCARGSLSIATALRWCYMTAVSQALAVQGVSSPDYGELDPQSETLALLSGFEQPAERYSLVARYTTIFLRRASLVMFGLCGKYEEDDFKCMQHLPEHQRLCEYLCLPTLDEAIKQLAATPLSIPAPEYLEFAGIYKLIRLPPRLDCFFNARDSTDDFPVDPAICLFCGSVIPFRSALVNPNERGQCTLHVAECTRNYGIYILPRRNYLILTINNGRGTFMEAPYLDVHGEPDETRRGRAHFLHPSRCDNITRKLWLENEIFDVIARKLDQNVDYGGWETM